ncbi:LOW QUALITY PROTEIN: centrosomal protein of 63 kDa-like [Salarias fasciatus]|uniref:LOW QUALITY PROTEIN: centrosomal protein of 63 kDa-like n=1 Tax=Salarias fasciatus TaxID=181472 RepID=UPI001176D85C|nr:LOW QUALITY PROTEIN: centrosomal protein of 63 kDa-like [Salarias fasciatus]
MPDLEPLSSPPERERVNQDLEIFGCLEGPEVQDVCSGRRHPRVLLNSPSTCVSCAVYHIVETKEKVESWCQQISLQRPPAVTPRSPVQLYVDGVAISTRESCPSWALLRKMNDVLGEVVHLVSVGVRSTVKARKRLARKGGGKRFLQCKLDSVSQRRRKEHATAVQREHEAGLQEISRLKTQLRLHREKVLKVQEELSDAEMLNQNYRQTSVLPKHRPPIVTEKLEAARGEVHQLQTGRAEAEDIYHKTQSELRCAEKNTREMKEEANKENSSFHKTLLIKKSHLAKKREDLKQLRMFEERLSAEIEEDESVVALTEEKCAAANLHIAEMTEREKKEKDSISFLKLQLEEAVEKNEALRMKLSSAEEDIERRRLQGDAQVCLIQERIQCLGREDSDLRTENLQLQLNLEDHHSRTRQSEATVKLLREERKQILQKISDGQQQIESCRQEVSRAEQQHRLKLEELEKQQREASTEEQKIQTHMQSLRKDLSGQMTSQQLLKARCVSLNEEVKQLQRSSDLTNQQLDEDLQKQREVTETLRANLQKLKTLREDLETLKSGHRKTSAFQEMERNLNSEKLRAARDSERELQDRREHSVRCTTELMEKTEEEHRATVKLQESVQQMQEDIETLQEHVDILEGKNSPACLMIQRILSQIEERKLQTQQLQQIRSAHATVRREKMEETQEALQVALKKNHQLASDYSSLQKVLVEARREAVRSLTQRNQDQGSFNDYRTLSGLQRRMHRSLERSLAGRGLVCGAELDRFCCLSAQTDQNLRDIQNRLSEDMKLDRPEQNPSNTSQDEPEPQQNPSNTSQDEPEPQQNPSNTSQDEPEPQQNPSNTSQDEQEPLLLDSNSTPPT